MKWTTRIWQQDNEINNIVKEIARLSQTAMSNVFTTTYQEILLVTVAHNPLRKVEFRYKISLK